MKKIFNLIVATLLVLIVGLRAEALTFEEAFNQTNKTPMVTFIYADWADESENLLNSYRSIQGEFANSYNFTELNIASKDAKFFNSKFHIYPNLPYVLMFRDNGKVSRYIPKSCLEEESCMRSKLKSFIL